MKNTHCRLIILILLLTTTIAKAQDNWIGYSTSINKQGYAGHKFKLTALIRTEGDDVDASSRLWIRVDREREKGFFNNMWDAPIKSSAWKKYSIEGTIDKDYTNIVFGVICQYNGKFYFDDIEISVQMDNQKWVSIFKADFEKETPNWRFGRGDTPLNPPFKYELISDKVKQGNKCLLISGEGVPNYGTNGKVGKYAKVNGIELYYEIYGTGKPLVILHGNGGSIETAGVHLPYFAQHYKVIAVDSRGQGKSIDNESDLTYELMASDISGLLDELKIDSALVWGQSDGAILAIILALNHPKKVKKAVAFAANVVPDTIGIETPIFHWIEDKAKNSPNKKRKQLMTLMWKHPNIAPSKLKAINAAILIMSGDRDFVPLSHTLDIFKNIPNSNLCVIPGATHMAAWEKPKLFQEIVIDFFEKPFAKPNTIDWFR